MAVAVDLSEVSPAPTAQRCTCTCDAKQLRSAVARLSKLADPGSASPALSDILVCTGRDSITLIATDLIAEHRITIPAAVEIAGEMLISPRHLRDALRAARREVTLAHIGNAVRVRADAARYDVPCGDPSEFPIITNPPRESLCTLPAAELARMVSRIEHAISRDEGRPHLASAFFERTGGVLRVITTDGHRMALAEVASEGPDFDILVHRRVAEAIARMDLREGNVSIRRDDANGWLVTSTEVVKGKIPQALFPSWRQVVPEGYESIVIVDREALTGALRCVTPRGILGVKLTFDHGRDTFTISTDDGDGHQSAVEVEARYRGPVAPPKQFGINARYLRDMLDAIDDQTISLQLSGDLDPVKIVASDGRFIMLCMPMRV